MTSRNSATAVLVTPEQAHPSKPGFFLFEVGGRQFYDQKEGTASVTSDEAVEIRGNYPTLAAAQTDKPNMTDGDVVRILATDQVLRYNQSNDTLQDDDRFGPSMATAVMDAYTATADEVTREVMFRDSDTEKLYRFLSTTAGAKREVSPGTALPDASNNADWTQDTTLLSDRATTTAEMDRRDLLQVNVTDIIDNRTSTDVDKPLSANQGKLTKDELDAHKLLVGESFGHLPDALAATVGQVVEVYDDAGTKKYRVANRTAFGEYKGDWSPVAGGTVAPDNANITQAGDWLWVATDGVWDGVTFTTGQLLLAAAPTPGVVDLTDWRFTVARTDLPPEGLLADLITGTEPALRIYSPKTIADYIKGFRVWYDSTTGTFDADTLFVSNRAATVGFGVTATVANMPEGHTTNMSGLVSVVGDTVRGKAFAFICEHDNGAAVGLWHRMINAGVWGSWTKVTDDVWINTDTIVGSLGVSAGQKVILADAKDIILTVPFAGAHTAIRIAPRTDWSNCNVITAGVGWTVSGQPAASSQEVVYVPNHTTSTWEGKYIDSVLEGNDITDIGDAKINRDNQGYSDHIAEPVVITGFPTAVKDARIAVSVVQVASTEPSQAIKDAAKRKTYVWGAFDTGAGYIWIQTDAPESTSDAARPWDTDKDYVGPDNVQFSQQMPATVANGDDYVAATGETLEPDGFYNFQYAADRTAAASVAAIADDAATVAEVALWNLIGEVNDEKQDIAVVGVPNLFTFEKGVKPVAATKKFELRIRDTAVAGNINIVGWNDDEVLVFDQENGDTPVGVTGTPLTTFAVQPGETWLAHPSTNFNKLHLKKIESSALIPNFRQSEPFISHPASLEAGATAFVDSTIQIGADNRCNAMTIARANAGYFMSVSLLDAREHIIELLVKGGTQDSFNLAFVDNDTSIDLDAFKWDWVADTFTKSAEPTFSGQPDLYTLITKGDMGEAGHYLKVRVADPDLIERNNSRFRIFTDSTFDGHTAGASSYNIAYKITPVIETKFVNTVSITADPLPAAIGVRYHLDYAVDGDFTLPSYAGLSSGDRLEVLNTLGKRITIKPQSGELLNGDVDKWILADGIHQTWHIEYDGTTWHVTPQNIPINNRVLIAESPSKTSAQGSEDLVITDGRTVADAFDEFDFIEFVWEFNTGSVWGSDIGEPVSRFSTKRMALIGTSSLFENQAGSDYLRCLYVLTESVFKIRVTGGMTYQHMEVYGIKGQDMVAPGTFLPAGPHEDLLATGAVTNQSSSESLPIPNGWNWNDLMDPAKGNYEKIYITAIDRFWRTGAVVTATGYIADIIKGGRGLSLLEERDDFNQVSFYLTSVASTGLDADFVIAGDTNAVWSDFRVYGVKKLTQVIRAEDWDVSGFKDYPPFGVEVDTGRKWCDGKPIYKMCIQVPKASLPSSNARTFPHGIAATMGDFRRITGEVINATEVRSLPYIQPAWPTWSNVYFSIRMDATNIHMQSHANYGTWDHANFEILYTKA